MRKMGLLDAGTASLIGESVDSGKQSKPGLNRFRMQDAKDYMMQ